MSIRNSKYLLTPSNQGSKGPSISSNQLASIQHYKHHISMPPPPPPPPHRQLMANLYIPPPIDPNSGFCRETNTFHSLRPLAPLPQLSSPLSVTSYAFSLLPSPLPYHPALVDATTATSLTYPDLISQIQSLSSSLQSNFHFSKGDVAFIISPPRLDLPVLCLALFSIGVVVSPANPASTPSEISRLINLVNPAIAFAVSSTASKLPTTIPTLVLLDSPKFSTFFDEEPTKSIPAVDIYQTDVAAIMFSSGTTGLVKAVALPHRRYIAMVEGLHALRQPSQPPDVTLLTSPMFHSMGFNNLVKGVALGETTVLMNRPGFGDMMGAVERYGVTVVATAPPVVVAMARSEEVSRFDLSKLRVVACGGAPLPVESGKMFAARFPWVQLHQVYGSTEAGRISWTLGLDKCHQLRSVGHLLQNIEAKIVDIVTGKPLSLGQQGELWVRSPATMIGYVGDKGANAFSFESDGWLKTGDICYFDNNGSLFIVDRLKELIKYKAYQVSPAELEQVLQSVPDIVDAAVIPYPDEEVGQIPTALVVRKARSNLDEAQIIDYVAKQVAPYKKIRKVFFVNSILKSAAGKILRRELASHVIPSLMPRL